jgi:hypothetical protein
MRVTPVEKENGAKSIAGARAERLAANDGLGRRGRSNDALRGIQTVWITKLYPLTGKEDKRKIEKLCHRIAAAADIRPSRM